MCSQQHVFNTNYIPGPALSTLLLYIYTHMYVCVYIYIHTHVCVYTHTHTHTHTQSFNPHNRPLGKVLLISPLCEGTERLGLAQGHVAHGGPSKQFRSRA